MSVQERKMKVFRNSKMYEYVLPDHCKSLQPEKRKQVACLDCDKKFLGSAGNRICSACKTKKVHEYI